MFRARFKGFFIFSPVVYYGVEAVALAKFFVNVVGSTNLIPHGDSAFIASLKEIEFGVLLKYFLHNVKLNFAQPYLFGVG